MVLLVQRRPEGTMLDCHPLASNACETNNALCKKGAVVAGPARAGGVTLNAGGTGTFPAVPAGTYYVVGQAIYNQRHLVWNYRVDLKAGDNKVTLSAINATLK